MRWGVYQLPTNPITISEPSGTVTWAAKQSPARNIGSQRTDNPVPVIVGELEEMRHLRAGETAWQLKGIAAVKEDLGSVPSTWMVTWDVL